jgi:hypothetical protein
MVDFDAAYQAIKDRAYSVWPETMPGNKGGGIMEAEHHSMIPWDREVLPFGAIVIDPSLGTPMTMDALVFRQTVDIYYVNYVKGGSSGIRQRIQSLIQSLWPDPPNPPNDVVFLEYGQVEDIIGYTVADSLYPNYFFRSRNSMHRAGRLQFRYLVWALN